MKEREERERCTKYQIRDSIFERALTSYEDKSRPYNPKSTDYKHYHDYFKIRPGFFHHHRTDTALLRTCRLIHSETRLMPVAINSHVLYYNPSHILSFPLPTNATSYFRNMTDEQLAAVQHIHIFAERKRLTSKDPGTYLSLTAFAELGYLRDGSGPGHLKACPRRRKGPFPKRFTITVRHTDWRITRYDPRLHPEPRPYLCLENMLRNEHWENVFGV
ncbi:hypothetical protein OEA41_006553 [Lepraria neglecta]|uniref:Uncharacterized protein n=1 Tax=Lepraria neglecta TaxID=209136 RepID=A0AAD9Z854_9LECA|nr:hypothetical protein OEA41_006553 [Lepraria neglecta]